MRRSNAGNHTNTRNVVDFVLQRPLNTRREIQVELPEFLIVLLEERVKEANEGSSEEDDMVTIDNLVEYQLAELLTIRDVAELDIKLPGFSSAVQEWIASTRA